MSLLAFGLGCTMFSIATLHRWRSARLDQQLALAAIGLLGCLVYVMAALQD